MKEGEPILLKSFPQGKRKKKTDGVHQLRPSLRCDEAM